MYEAFYGLREKPFNLTPDPRFLYLSEKHKEAFAHLLYGIKNRTGFVMVSGEIGTGKTTVCRTLLTRLDENTEVAFLSNPAFSSIELLRTVNEQFGIPTQGDTVKELCDELNHHLLERHSRGKTCVLLIDEAQTLSPELLELLRLLSNLETESEKLVQIVLVGQPELVATLALPELRQLDQRITARYHLKPLNRREALQYIAYRLRVAGGRRKVRFTPRAVKAIHRASGGIPRVINALCDRALLIGYTLESREITVPIVKRSVQEIRGEPVRVKKTRQPWVLARYLPAPALVAAAVLIILFGKYVAEPFAERLPLSYASAPPQVPGTMSSISVGLPPANITPVHEEVQSVPQEASLQAPQSSLAGLIDGADPQLIRNAALLALLRAWDVPLVGTYPANDSLDSIADFAFAHGVGCEVLPISFPQLVSVNLPLLAKVTGDRQTVWLGLVSLNEKDVRIVTGIAETTLMSREEFEKRYLDIAVVVWRDPTPDASLLRSGDKGERVRWLQEQLRTLGLLDGLFSGAYEAETVAAVRKLQAMTGLKEDGIFGPKTRMVLLSRLPEFAGPTLRAQFEQASETALSAEPLQEVSSGEPVAAAGTAGGQQPAKDAPATVSIPSELATASDEFEDKESDGFGEAALDSAAPSPPETVTQDTGRAATPPSVSGLPIIPSHLESEGEPAPTHS